MNNFRVIKNLYRFVRQVYLNLILLSKRKKRFSTDKTLLIC